MSCQAIEDRKQLTAAMKAAMTTATVHDTSDLEGTEEEMLLAFAVLRGAVIEYQAGGDQLVELCTCGRHTITI